MFLFRKVLVNVLSVRNNSWNKLSVNSNLFFLKYSRNMKGFRYNKTLIGMYESRSL